MMSAYNYLEHVTNDVKNYIKEHSINTDELTNYQIVDMLWYADEVTGNGKRGHYLSDQNTAKEYVESNQDLLKHAVDVDVCNSADLKKWKCEGDYVSIDVTLRCYVLVEAVDRVLADLK